jgi:hypothetical protein
MGKTAKSARPAYAVCPRLERSGSTRAPKLFATEAEAKKFLQSEITAGSIEIEARDIGLTIEQVRARRAERRAQSRKDRRAATEKVKRGEIRPSDYPHHLRPIRNEDQGWQGPVPVVNITDYRGPKCNHTLRDFLPTEAVGQMPELKTDEEINRALEGRSADYTCCLGADWRFDELEANAWGRVGHQYQGRRYVSIGEIVVTAIHDLEAAFRMLHPDAPCRAVADFLRSWQVQQHISDFCSRLANSEKVEIVTGNRFDGAKEVERARVNLYRQLAAYAHELLDEDTLSSAADAMPETGVASPSAALNLGDQAPAEAGWGAVAISFLSDERVQIRSGGKTETRNYAELGFADGRNGTPNQAWLTLRVLAQERGMIRDGAKTGGEWPKVERRIQEIRKLLRKHFAIAADPLPFVAGTGYQASFQIFCAPSFES